MEVQPCKKTDPQREATYQIDRNINYTNFCTEYCSTSARFIARSGRRKAIYFRSETIYKKIRGNA